MNWITRLSARSTAISNSTKLRVGCYERCKFSVPSLIANASCFVGLYRIPGSDPVVKELLEKFLRGKGLPKLDQYDDIHVVASCLKQFFRRLKVGMREISMIASMIVGRLSIRSWQRVIKCQIEKLLELTDSKLDS